MNWQLVECSVSIATNSKPAEIPRIAAYFRQAAVVLHKQTPDGTFRRGFYFYRL